MPTVVPIDKCQATGYAGEDESLELLSQGLEEAL
jgi:hypothetical protein